MQAPNFLQLLFFSLLYQLCFAVTCHFPNGRTAATHVPCEDGPNSACCGKDAICLTNGLCLDTVQPFGLSRASCTDPSWSIDECAKVCSMFIDKPSNIDLYANKEYLADTNQSNGCSLVLYNNTATGVEYCCNSIVENPDGGRQPVCDKNTSTVTVESAAIIAGHAALKSYKRADGNRDVAIGTGVGIPLGVIAIVSIAWAVYERRNRSKILRSPAGTGIIGDPYAANYHAAATNTASPVVYPHARGPVEKPADTPYNNTQPVELEERSQGGFGR